MAYTELAAGRVGLACAPVVDDLALGLFNDSVRDLGGGVSRRWAWARMAGMNFTELRACLEKDGWPIEEVSEATLRSCFRGGGQMFPVFIHQEPEHVTFAVIPFLRMPEDEVAGDAVVDRLLRLNREMNMAKFSVDEDGDVVLSVDYRLEDLDPSEVRDAIDVLSFYAEKYQPEMRRLAARE